MAVGHLQRSVFIRFLYSLPKRALDFVTFTLRFYPILHIAAITADITDDRDFLINVKVEV